MLGSWGEKILRDLKRSINTQGYKKTSYMGCATMLTWIAYHAVGMIDEV